VPTREVIPRWYDRADRPSSQLDRGRDGVVEARRIEREAARLGLHLNSVVEDLDQSGGREDRPGLSAIIERIEEGTVGGLMVTRLDRFSRDLVQALRLAARIEEAGGRLYVIEEAVDLRSPDGALMVQLPLAIATHQRRLANAYFDKSKADAVERGVPIQPRLAPGIVAVRNADGKRVGVEVDGGNRAEHAPCAARATGCGRCARWPPASPGLRACRRERAP